MIRKSIKIGKRVARRAKFWATGKRDYQPFVPISVDRSVILQEIEQTLQVQHNTLMQYLADFEALYQKERYADRFGERKTLSFEESLILYILLRSQRPASIIEIGTQYGKSTRKLIDMAKSIGLNSNITCFDVVDEVKYFDKEEEAELILKDLTPVFEEAVLQNYTPGLIFLDAHPYYLLKEVISKVIASPDPWILAVHDCSKGLCNPGMSLRKEDLRISSKTGHWERHVLAELFGITDVLSDALNDRETNSCRLRIFSTHHGLAVIQKV